MINFSKYCEVEDNKYLKWYNNIVCRRLLQKPNEKEYCEKHHYIPKCIYRDSKEVVLLTAREHFVLHLLLPRFIKDLSLKKKLIFALWGMCNQKTTSQLRRAVCSRTYAEVKFAFSKSISGNNHWMKDPIRRQNLSKKCIGRKHSEETKNKLSKIFMGRKFTKEWKEKIGLANKGLKRTKDMNTAQSKRMKEAYAKGLVTSPTLGVKKEKFTCKYCGELCDTANLKKWHNANSDCLLRKAKRMEKTKNHRNNTQSPTRTSYCEKCNRYYGKDYFEKIHQRKCCKSHSVSSSAIT